MGGNRRRAGIPSARSAEKIVRFLDQMQMDTRLTAEIEAIDHALVRPGTDQYGSCKHYCGGISAGRLQALPATTLCVACAQAREVRGA